MFNETFHDFGRAFHEWHNTGRVNFVYGTDGKNFKREIERVSKLVEYVRNKKMTGSQEYIVRGSTYVETSNDTNTRK